VPGLALLGSQAGHLLAFQLLFGSAAQQIQSSGAHAYFPVLAKTALGAAAAVLLGAGVIVGLARVLGRELEKDSAPPYLRLLAVLFTIQLVAFGGQETLEAALSGAPAPSADALLLSGTLGQLPIAAVAALALRWLLVRVRPALAQIRSYFAPVRRRLVFVPAVFPMPSAPGQALVISRLVRYSVRKRGPPTS
jgi:hypothetical protein